MTILYSAKSNVFLFEGSPLLSEKEYKDAKEVSEDVFSEFFQTVRDGRRRVAGKDGMPAWEDIPAPTAEEVKASQFNEANLKKSLLLSSAKETISGWQTDLLLGTISEEEKQSLILWREFIKKVEAINPDDAPKVKWPEPPATEQ
ncbi:tail fiber assembly protein [Cronobacter turicensis]|nr:tail fiber assembly protein [Cronobacter turicensis]EMA1790119.1 tail fiber assembly protein [Cronobacter turicensis]EMA1800183.1 tail fiber assembly protein [Cronobacter turicensis]EMA1847396.1 tail fiber assembly protein [Cronobacter turicensis]EMA1857641.1 tail fiber assembly protein [Cronobacter turicensis]